MFFGGLNGDGFFGEEYEDNYDVGYDRRENIGPSSARCKFCGKGGLYWYKKSGEGWRLYSQIFTHNNQTLHTCEAFAKYQKIKTAYSPCLGTGDRDMGFT